MSLLDLLGDLLSRFYKVDKENAAQINTLKAQIHAVNNYYENLKGKKPNLVIQGIILWFVCPIFAVIIYLILHSFFKNNPLFDEISSAIAPMFVIVTVIIIIINCIRGSAKYSSKKKRADEWWDKVGKNQVVSINNSINSIQSESTALLTANPLYWQIPDFWRNVNDVCGLYEIVLQRRAVSLEEAISVYYGVKDAQYQHEEIIDAIREAKEANERAYEETAQLREELEEKRREDDLFMGMF